MKTVTGLLLGVVGAAILASVPATAAPASKVRDVCVAAPTGGGGFNTFVFRGVEPLSPGGAISLNGIYFVTGSTRLAPLHGSAVMASDGSVRIGFFVHSTAQSNNDFTVAGVTDANFVGSVSFDSDGDFVPNGTLAMQQADCASIHVP